MRLHLLLPASLLLSACSERVYTGDELMADPALLAQTRDRCFGKQTTEQCKIVAKVLGDQRRRDIEDANRRAVEAQRRIFGGK